MSGWLIAGVVLGAVYLLGALWLIYELRVAPLWPDDWPLYAPELEPSRDDDREAA